jgi:hypothetical protein
MESNPLLVWVRLPRLWVCSSYQLRFFGCFIVLKNRMAEKTAGLPPRTPLVLVRFTPSELNGAAAPDPAQLSAAKFIQQWEANAKRVFETKPATVTGETGRYALNSSQTIRTGLQTI